MKLTIIMPCDDCLFHEQEPDEEYCWPMLNGNANIHFNYSPQNWIRHKNKLRKYQYATCDKFIQKEQDVIQVEN